MFISPAYAEAATDTVTTALTGASTAPASGFAAFFVTFAPIIFVFVIFYFFVIRPQKKRMEEYQRQVASMKRGDRVVTTGGLIGTIHRFDKDNPEVQLEVADGVIIRIQKNAIVELLARTSSTEEKK